MTDQLINEYKPDVVTPPGETLKDMLDAMGMTKAELADRIGKTPKTIGEIVKHNAPITPGTAMELEKVFGTPASFWNNRERRYRESLARLAERKRLEKEAAWLKTIPVRAMINAGWLKEYRDKADQAGAVLRFFGVATSHQWKKIWLSPQAAYRKSRAFASKPEACSVWLRKGELEAQRITCHAYDKARFRSLLGQIRSLTKTAPETFQREAVDLCAQAGVAVVFIRAIKGAPVYGATRWLTPQKALMQLSLRGKYEDLLWFTFFHEAGHILLHGKKDVFIEGNGINSEEEKEADRFASDFLISTSAWKRLIESDYRRKAVVKNFAEEIGVSPAIVVGRLHHEKLLPHSHLNDLRRRFDLE